MAQIFPSDIQETSRKRFDNDELETLVALRDDLPDEYRIYHSVHWSKAESQYTVFGEIDFVIVNAAGEVLVIEQKNGPLQETPKGLVKSYGVDKKLVSSQVQRNLGNFRDKFGKQNPQSPKLSVDYMIYCPEYRVVDVNAVGVDMRRTVDATSRDSLAARVEQLLETKKRNNTILVGELHNFLLNSFRIAPDVNAYKSSQTKVYRQLLSGLSDVIENLEFEPFRLRVVGTAGSGKTQVTMRFCERAIAAGKSPLLLCFNRPLADKLAKLAPKGATVNTYYGFCKTAAEKVGVEVDFSKSEDPKFWRNVQEDLLAATLANAPRYDCLIVDEGQDFKADWYDILQLFLKEGATQLWLEDPLQNLRGTDPIPLPGFVTYRETANFRTPTSIASFIKATLDVDFEQRNALPGLGVALYDYDQPVEIQHVLNSRVHELGKVGFKPEDIAIVSCCGMQSTALADFHQVGKHKLRKFTGDYNSRNEQIYTDGDLSFDTIYRFKGQQAPVVILVDMDDRLKLNEWTKGLLYCAMTRATVRLELVVQKECPWMETFRESLDEK